MLLRFTLMRLENKKNLRIIIYSYVLRNFTEM